MQGLSPTMRAALKASARATAVDMMEDLREQLDQGTRDADDDWDIEDIISEWFDNRMEMILDDHDCWGDILAEPFITAMALSPSIPAEVLKLHRRYISLLAWSIGEASSE